MSFLYTVLLLLGLPVLLFRFPKGFLRRLYPAFSIPHCYWIHCASLGEVSAVQPFIKGLQNTTDVPLVVSAFTRAGFDRAEQIQGINAIYLPLDFIFIVRIFLSRLNPNKLFLVETEIWPNLIRQSDKRGVEIYCINARLSDTSIEQYQKIHFIKHSISLIKHIFCQSELDKMRFISLGVSKDKISISGNVKFDAALQEDMGEKISRIQTQYDWNTRAVFVAASIRKGEEILIINAYQRIKQSVDNVLLVIAPRHSKEFKPIENLCIEKGLDVSKRSENSGVVPKDVFLLDTLGELTAFYSMADVIFVGGSLKNYGGHNMIEAAFFDAAVVVGTHTDHFADVVNVFKEEQGIVEVADEKALAAEVIELLQNKEKRHLYITNAHQVIAQNQGKTQTIIDAVMGNSVKELAVPVKGG